MHPCLEKNREHNVHQSGSTFQVGRTKMKKNMAGNYFEVGSGPVQSGFHTYYGHDWNLTMLSVPPLESNIKKLWHHDTSRKIMENPWKITQTHPKSKFSKHGPPMKIRSGLWETYLLVLAELLLLLEVEFLLLGWPPLSVVTKPWTNPHYKNGVLEVKKKLPEGSTHPF